DRDADARDLVRAHHACAAHALGLGQRRLDVGDLDIEGDVAAVALWPGADAAADPDAIRVRVPLTRGHRVVRRSHLLAELPAEELRVVAPQLLAVLADDLEVDYWLSHPVSFRARPYGGALTATYS